MRQAESPGYWYPGDHILIKRRVVVTGLGLVTPLGNTAESTWHGLISGKSGAGPITKFDVSNSPVRFACEVKDFNPLNYVEKKEARKMGAFTHYAIAASDEALANCGLRISEANAEDIGVYISTVDATIDTAEIFGANYFGVVVNGDTGTPSASITGSNIHNIGEVPFNGTQHGVGIYNRAPRGPLQQPTKFMLHFPRPSRCR